MSGGTDDSVRVWNLQDTICVATHNHYENKVLVDCLLYPLFSCMLNCSTNALLNILIRQNCFHVLDPLYFVKNNRGYNVAQPTLLLRVGGASPICGLLGP